MKYISLFKCNHQVEVIDKSHCSLEDVPNFQNYSRSLEELFLDANKLTFLNDNVFKLTRLRRFSFSDNAILDIPPDIAKLVNLVELDCSRNKIQNIPDQIKFLRGLQICDFSANNIEYLPPGLVQLKNLTCLTLNYCPIKNLPEDFGLLKNLESLELRENELESLPLSITGLESLKKLDVGRNLIRKLPEDISKLSNLEYLLVDGNRLESIPSEIGKLENLQCLDLSQQEYGLNSLPDDIGGLISLTDLHLSDNHIQSLPDGIGQLRCLTIFKADNNFLSELNPNIGGCTSLQELVLTSNQITRLPSTIGSLSDLRSLNLDSNLLKQIPTQIGHLRQLGILSLRDNFLTNLPNEIGQLCLLRVMDVSGNRLEYLPLSLADLGLKALWLSKNQAQPLPKLQIDEISNMRVLTCYLLPQQSEDEDIPTQDEDHQEEFKNINRQAAVSFDAPTVDDNELTDEHGWQSDDVNFIRHDTPHPRELRARHQKLFNNVEKTELKGQDNASFSMSDNQNILERAGVQDSNIVPMSYQNHFSYESNGLPDINSSVTEEPIRRPQQSTNLGCYVLDILVRRSKNHKPGLGLSIAGGKDTPPFKDDDEGIFVSKVTRGGPAEAAGVRVGDKILAVNNNLLYEGITHLKAVDIFKKIKPDCPEGFTMRVLRDPNFVVDESDPSFDPIQDTRDQEKQAIFPPQSNALNGATAKTTISQFAKKEPEMVKSSAATLPPNLSLVDNTLSKHIIYTTLVKDYRNDLGLILENRVDESEAKAWPNAVIASIKPNSIAARDGKLQADDRLLSINGVDVTGIDIERVYSLLNGTERFIRIVVSRGDGDDPIGAALKNMPVRPPLGSWFSSTSNMSHRPSLIESYQRPTFGSVSSLQKQAPCPNSRPQKPPKPTYLLQKDEDPVAKPRVKSYDSNTSSSILTSSQLSEAERRAAWRRDRLKSIEDDVEMAKLIAEAQRRRQQLEEK